MNIRTSTREAPIPFGKYDWAAWDSDADDGTKRPVVGLGATEAKAIAALKALEQVTC